MRPFRSRASPTIRDTSSSDETSARMPPSGGSRSAIDDLRSLGLEPGGDRRADPLRAAGDDRDLPVEGAHASGENEVGTRIRFCCVWKSGCTFARNSFQRGSAWSRARRSSRSANES